MFYASPTKILFHFPTPFGWSPIVWYTQDGAIVTPIMILFGVITTIVAIGIATERWWAGFGTLIGFNSFFAFMTIGGAVGCKRDGCYLAEATAVAGMWQIAVFEIGLFVILLMGLIIMIDKLVMAGARISFVILSIPLAITLILPIAIALLTQQLGYVAPGRFVVYILEYHRSLYGWTVIVSFGLFLFGLVMLLYNESLRFFRSETVSN